MLWSDDRSFPENKARTPCVTDRKDRQDRRQTVDTRREHRWSCHLTSDSTAPAARHKHSPASTIKAHAPHYQHLRTDANPNHHDRASASSSPPRLERQRIAPISSRRGPDPRTDSQSTLPSHLELLLLAAVYSHEVGVESRRHGGANHGPVLGHPARSINPKTSAMIINTIAP